MKIIDINIKAFISYYLVIMCNCGRVRHMTFLLALASRLTMPEDPGSNPSRGKKFLCYIISNQDCE